MRPSSESGGRRAGGRYVLGDLLGRGGMAEVFAGHSIGDHGFQKPVAIKRLLPELANDHVFVERLIEEAKLLVGMQHGNVVSVLDLARDGDDVFLVMEFVDGPSLRQLLKSRGQRGLPLGVATYIVQAAAAGLEFAHGRPGGAIIHADISPSNILLTTSGEVRVADFGIARRENQGQGIVEGKWAYMAPEQARGESLTPRSDVFALGVVLYELICGAHPFGRQVTAEERDSEPMRVIPPRVVKPSIPPGIDAICMKALAHDPRQRYARMQHVIDAINEERFSNQWREGASDLMKAIRECAAPGSAAAAQPRTMVTDRPLTIATRSLIRELTPHGRGSSPSISRSASASVSASASASQSYSEVPRAARGSHPVIMDSGAQTTAIPGGVAADVVRAVQMMQLPQLPAALRADGTPMPPFKLPMGMPAGQDLASVHGGNTHSQHLAAEDLVGIDKSSTIKWTIIVLAVAALIGALVAMFIVRGSAPTISPIENPPVMVAPQTETKAVDPKADEPTSEVKAEAKVDDKTETKVDDKSETKTKTDEVKTETKTDEVKTETKPETKPDDVKPDDAAKPTKAIKPQPRPAAAPGWLRVNTDPWSNVTVTGPGGTQELATPSAKFTLAPGRYTVTMKSPDYRRPITATVVIESGRTKQISKNFEEDF